MLIKIKHRYTNAVLYSCDVPDDVASGLRVRATLEKATASGADLRGADLRGAVLSDADLSGADLRGAVLRGADLRDAVLRDTDLRDADLRYAVLSGADLRGAVLSGAVLRGADLSDADLSGADLIGADLSGADLRGADLSGADLSGADGKPLPCATPTQAVENLDKVREIILDNDSRLNMGLWHGDNEWLNRTCAEEAVCGTTHCLAGWLQVCSAEPALRQVDAQLAGILAAPVAAKMFFRDNAETLEWLRNREYAK